MSGYMATQPKRVDRRTSIQNGSVMLWHQQLIFMHGGNFECLFKNHGHVLQRCEKSQTSKLTSRLNDNFLRLTFLPTALQFHFQLDSMFLYQFRGPLVEMNKKQMSSSLSYSIFVKPMATIHQNPKITCCFPWWWHFCIQLYAKNVIIKAGGGGHSHWKVVWECAALKTPFFRPFFISGDPPFQVLLQLQRPYIYFWENFTFLTTIFTDSG